MVMPWHDEWDKSQNSDLLIMLLILWLCYENHTIDKRIKKLEDKDKPDDSDSIVGPTHYP